MSLVFTLISVSTALLSVWWGGIRAHSYQTGFARIPPNTSDVAVTWNPLNCDAAPYNMWLRYGPWTPLP
jgi:hypothetical protein